MKMLIPVFSILFMGLSGCSTNNLRNLTRDTIIDINVNDSIAYISSCSVSKKDTQFLSSNSEIFNTSNCVKKSYSANELRILAENNFKYNSNFTDGHQVKYQPQVWDFQIMRAPFNLKNLTGHNITIPAYESFCSGDINISSNDETIYFTSLAITKCFEAKR